MPSQAKRYLGYWFPNAVNHLGKVYRAVRVAKRMVDTRDAKAVAAKAKRRFGEFDAVALRRFLQEWGVSKGDSLLVHSSWDALPNLSGSPTDLIGELQEVVGAGGTLCMPTFPAVGPEYPGRVFDVRKTPSTTGLLAEYFRRCPNVVRSLQLRSVAARGPLAEWLTSEHHLSPYPSGTMSPYYRLAEADGKVLTLGLPPTYATIFHCAEDVLEHHFPRPIYKDRPYLFEAKGVNGKTLTVEACEVKSRYVYARDGNLMLPYFSEDIVSQRTFHGVPCALIQTRPFVDRLIELAKQGIHMYGFHFPRLATA